MALPRTSITLTLAAGLAVSLTLIGYQWPCPWLVYLCKPLATLLLIVIAFYHWARQNSTYSQWIVIGLVCSLIGDVLLIWPNQYFIAGLVAFLLTHVAYLVALTRHCKFPASSLIWLAYFVAASGFFLILSPALPAALQIPVAVYALLLSTMAAQAMSRLLLFRSGPAMCAAFGALFFMASDMLLALHRFRRPLLYSNIFILVLYYIGQCLIAWSTSPALQTKQPR